MPRKFFRFVFVKKIGFTCGQPCSLLLIRPSLFVVGTLGGTPSAGIICIGASMHPNPCEIQLGLVVTA
jgi:hypothetical protein